MSQYLQGLGDEAVLNGIAYNPTTKNFYITGKNWPLLFEVKFN
jgi:glutamine cyclotransferase